MHNEPKTYNVRTQNDYYAEYIMNTKDYQKSHTNNWINVLIKWIDSSQKMKYKWPTTKQRKKKCSTSSAMREMKIKAASRFHFSHMSFHDSQMAVIKSVTTNAGKKTLYTADGNAKESSHNGNQYGSSSGNLKQTSHKSQATESD